jgi:hypothetical protein
MSMKKTLKLTLATFLLSFSVYSQELRPYQFIQFFKAYQLESSIHISVSTDYLKTYDKHWLLMEPFTTRTNTEDAHFWLYGPEKVEQPEHRVSATTDRSNGSHYVEYEFNEQGLFNLYLNQINNMNPQDGGVTELNGSTGRIYNVGGLTFVLRTYPPGFKAEHIVYTVALSDVNK